MRTPSRITACSSLVFLVAMLPLCAQTPQIAKADSKPTKSDYIRGPYGLEGWTMNWPLKDSDEQEPYPLVLEIARDGREVQRIDGHPFIWKWMFWSDGRQVAFESGPRHFAMGCFLVDVETGHQLAVFDCEYTDLPKDAPEWLKALVQLP